MTEKFQIAADQLRAMTEPSAIELAEALEGIHEIGGRPDDELVTQIAAALRAAPASEPVAREENLFVTENDRKFAADIIEDMGTFEEGITEIEKMEEWCRNIRYAAERAALMSSPAPFDGSLNSGESEPVVMPVRGAGEAISLTEMVKALEATAGRLR